MPRSIPLPSPSELRQACPLGALAAERIRCARQRIHTSLHGQGFVVIVGPCSLDHESAALEFADRLAVLQESLPSEWTLVMRSFFEKARSCEGWKGLVHGESLLDHGNRLLRVRRLMVDLLERGISLGAELLQPMIVPYVQDCLSWGCIGARTCMSQPHREVASGVPFPVGIKNDLSGEIQQALSGVCVAQQPHSSYGIGDDGRLMAMITSGNPDSHLVLRGGLNGPNIACGQLDHVILEMQRLKIPTRFLIDCGHGNAYKTVLGQLDTLQQLPIARPQLGGIMLESYLLEGQQPYHPSIRIPGLSVTDPCLSWDQTVASLQSLAECWAAGSIQVNQS